MSGQKIDKKELTKVQQYAVKAASEKIDLARNELRVLLREIAVELGIDLNNPAESWRLSDDMKYLERIVG